ncbi:hypothetical protein FB567DRAFT_500734 [Paraphoma chrysanthemicola]|uniref:Uncharacterized protein n=1 Tax=Paraphoma chrysanthemicola TaxID=798071 RepID=A0A8K0R1I9_9PLEO|nr:hypothetical protein FB567DRAFT_500734 [Paraphoma chrysanthemicola]
MGDQRTRRVLRINPTPFRPTLLSIPPSPFSPRTPLTPAPKYHRADTTPYLQHENFESQTHDAPSSPLAWTWQCHQCSRSYSLSATRRCLDDGHAFCSGTTVLKSARIGKAARRSKRHRACKSEFDYSGWKDWGRWKRARTGLGVRSQSTVSANEYADREKDAGSGKKLRNCWLTCDYPSECRWGRQFGVHTPLSPTFPSVQIHSEPIDLDATPRHISEGVLKAENLHLDRAVETEEGSVVGKKTDLWGLLASAKKRKSGGGGGKMSPLASCGDDREGGGIGHEKDGDGDIVMQNIDPALLALPDPGTTDAIPAPVSSQTVGSVARDMLRDLLNRKSSRRGRVNTTGRGQGDEYPAPLLMVPKSVLAKERDDVKMGDPEAMLEGFAPLERVRSRRVGVVVQ